MSTYLWQQLLHKDGAFVLEETSCTAQPALATDSSQRSHKLLIRVQAAGLAQHYFPSLSVIATDGALPVAACVGTVVGYVSSEQVEHEEESNSITEPSEAVDRTFRPGDTVVALSDACYGQFCLVDPSQVVPVQGSNSQSTASLTTEQATLLGAVHLHTVSALYALRYGAGLSHGESVLVLGGANSENRVLINVAANLNLKVAAAAFTAQEAEELQASSSVSTVLDVTDSTLELVLSSADEWTKGFGFDCVILGGKCAEFWPQTKRLCIDTLGFGGKWIVPAGTLQLDPSDVQCLNAKCARVMFSNFATLWLSGAERLRLRDSSSEGVQLFQAEKLADAARTARRCTLPELRDSFVAFDRRVKSRRQQLLSAKQFPSPSDALKTPTSRLSDDDDRLFVLCPE